MDFKNGVKNIQTAGYNDARTVYFLLELRPNFQFKKDNFNTLNRLTLLGKTVLP